MSSILVRRERQSSCEWKPVSGQHVVRMGSKADVMQLVRVARHIDSGDTTVAVLERHGINRSVFFPQHETSKAVDDGNTHLRGIERRALARYAVKETQDLICAVDGIERSGSFAASISVQHDILGLNLPQRNEPHGG